MREKAGPSRFEDEIAAWSCSIISLLFLLASPLSLIGGIGILIVQCYQFLLLGDWFSVSVADGLAKLGIAWATNPETWIGIWKIVDLLPLSISLLVVGFLSWKLFIKFSLIGWTANDRLKERKHKRNDRTL